MRLKRPTIEEESRAIVLLAFRNGPIENVHAGRARCSRCTKSGITDEEMKQINKTAVNRVWMLLKMRERQPQRYRACVLYGSRITKNWDPPEEDALWRKSCEQLGRLLFEPKKHSTRRGSRGRDE